MHGTNEKRLVLTLSRIVCLSRGGDWNTVHACTGGCPLRALSCVPNCVWGGYNFFWHVCRCGSLLCVPRPRPRRVFVFMCNE